MSERLIARLVPAPRPGMQWRWDLEGDSAEHGGEPGDTERFSVYLPDVAVCRLLGQLEMVDRFHESSDFSHAADSRNAVVELLLDEVWSQLIDPLVLRLSKFLRLTLVVPGPFGRLPLACARARRSGESLVHFCEVEVEILPEAELVPPEVARRGVAPERIQSESGRVPLPGAVGPHRWHRRANAHRFDGHLEELPEHLAITELGAASTVLLMGCRTALLLPLLAGARAEHAVVSCWDVEDRHCARFGDSLISAMGNGLTAAGALRSVQASMTASPPYRWAGYSLVRIPPARFHDRTALGNDRSLHALRLIDS